MSGTTLLESSSAFDLLTHLKWDCNINALWVIKQSAEQCWFDLHQTVLSCSFLWTRSPIVNGGSTCFSTSRTAVTLLHQYSPNYFKCTRGQMSLMMNSLYAERWPLCAVGIAGSLVLTDSLRRWCCKKYTQTQSFENRTHDVFIQLRHLSLVVTSNN